MANKEIQLRCFPFSILNLLVVVLFALETTSAFITSFVSTSHHRESGRSFSLNNIPIDSKSAKAFPEQTPHSGRHFLPSHPAYKRPLWRRLFSTQKRRKRFMEGWYYRLTLVEHNVSFAFIVSIEDPGHSPPSELTLACIQIVGPDDGYLVQADRDDTKFWAWEGQQGLGCTFQYNEHFDSQEMELRTALSPDEWRDKVGNGFQVLPLTLQGRVRGHDGSLGGVLDGQGIPGSCDFDMTLTPLSGWGDCQDAEQKSTAGWLASFAVFEPHWQVTMADGRATGIVTWKNKTYEFANEPFYAEKNWGAALPTKWYWTQCNSFNGYTDVGTQLSITAGGGVRKIPFGQSEALGMVSVHYNGTFYEAVPWTGTMEWEVTTWGQWILKGRCTNPQRPFDVEFSARCDPQTTPGIVIRAPTVDEGMVYFARDSFEADATLSLWELEWDKTKKEYVRRNCPPIIDQAMSSTCAVEVGGGPWWDTWRGVSKMKQPMKAMVQFPYHLSSVRKRMSSHRRKAKGQSP